MLENLEQQLSQIPNIETLLIIVGIFILLIVFKAVALKQDLQDEARQRAFNQNTSQIPKSEGITRKSQPTKKSSNMEELIDQLIKDKTGSNSKNKKSMTEKQMRELLKNRGLSSLFKDE